MTARGAEWERETHTATAWGTQESGAGELHGEARAGGRTPGNPPPRPPTRRERGAAMVRGRRKGGDKEAGGKHVPEKPRECGETAGDTRPLKWPTSPPGVGYEEGGREASGVAENPQGFHHGVGGGSSRHMALTPP